MFVIFSACSLRSHSVIRLNVHVCTSNRVHKCVFVCIHSLIGSECVPAHTDNMLMNVCEETACEIQGGQC